MIWNLSLVNFRNVCHLYNSILVRGVGVILVSEGQFYRAESWGFVRQMSSFPCSLVHISQYAIGMETTNCPSNLCCHLPYWHSCRAASPEPLTARDGHVFWLLAMECEPKCTVQLLPHLLTRNSLALSFYSFPTPPGIVILTSFGRWQSCHQHGFLNDRMVESCLLAWNADLGAIT